jgi:hypothetical protein
VYLYLACSRGTSLDQSNILANGGIKPSLLYWGYFYQLRIARLDCLDMMYGIDINRHLEKRRHISDSTHLEFFFFPSCLIWPIIQRYQRGVSCCASDFHGTRIEVLSCQSKRLYIYFECCDSPKWWVGISR